MNNQLKKSKSHQNKIIFVGISAMIVIIAIVLIVQNSITAQVTSEEFMNKCTRVVPNIKLSRPLCEAEGYKECEERNPLWQYAMSKPSLCYKQCVWYVRDMCRKNAPYNYPHLN